MTTLLVEPLSVLLYQEFNITDESRHPIGAVIPYIYMHNAPAGTFTFSVINNLSETILVKNFTSADLKLSIETTDNYAHVFYPIIPTNPIQFEKGSYVFTLTATGYTKTDSSFLGWIRQHENLNNILGYVPESDGQNPLATRLKVYYRGIK